MKSFIVLTLVISLVNASINNSDVLSSEVTTFIRLNEDVTENYSSLKSNETNPQFSKFEELTVKQLIDFIPTILNISVTCNRDLVCIVNKCRIMSNNNSTKVSQQECVTLVPKAIDMTIEDFLPQNVLCGTDNEIVNNGTIINLSTIIDRLIVIITAVMSPVLLSLVYIFRRKLKWLVCYKQDGYKKTNDSFENILPFMSFRKRNLSIPTNIESEIIEIK